ncbi:hypothetical protein [Lysinibacillus pakistanensis]|uniref:Uncharacterized protein n=1 Tax=Lysinibacillus pakistanensis TaxID=759811 RepID=A0AAX3WU64_9BACI|nr:hypothetical protein [Lysinibacillus pakistanensis]MDM5230031.1 hypothetical protein [Lysinibacillus pakistanensis]WHY45629.1 hypothetical protein QNH22_20495 [Lysinibacillus pakistanensis]WHY50637.1 hypothetical protein QNH24_20460 [Lysinibacillus pakistanensis]
MKVTTTDEVVDSITAGKEKVYIDNGFVDTIEVVSTNEFDVTSAITRPNYLKEITTLK